MLCRCGLKFASGGAPQAVFRSESELQLREITGLALEAILYLRLRKSLGLHIYFVVRQIGTFDKHKPNILLCVIDDIVAFRSFQPYHIAGLQA